MCRRVPDALRACVQTMPLEKFLGIVVMAIGIGWYSQISLSKAPAAASGAGGQAGGGQLAGQHGAARPPPHRGPLAPVATGGGEDGSGDVARGYPGQVVSPRKATLFDK